MVTFLLAAAIAAAPADAPPAPAAADARPAIWAVRDHDTTVYIFGTFHALDGKSVWFTDRVQQAFSASDELVLETIIPAKAAPVPAFSTIPGQRVGALSVAPSASFAATRMAITAGKTRGMNVRYGADMVLRRAAEASGKRVDGLETFEFQLGMFSRMPAPAAPRAGDPVENGALDKLSATMAAMQTAWTRGDQAIFIHMLDQLRRSSPGTYQMMFTERNARWADWIAGRMQYPGTVFVAVGTGHLAGKDSLLVRLAELGIESRRLN